MQFAIPILTNTPLWVFAVLAVLVWQGGLALQPRTQPLWRLLIVPAVFLMMGVSRLLLGGKSASLVLIWIVAAAAFASLPLTIGVRAITVEPDGRISRPGSVLPLARNLGVFLLQYAVAVTAAMGLDAAAGVTIAGQAVSGACSGYFLGSAIALLRTWRAQSRGRTERRLAD